MQRFRKRSDAKRSEVPSLADSTLQSPDSPLDQFALPPASDFRTSLILPDLSRRFTILRSSGDPYIAESLKARFADQRARGAENQVTEEEEEMILETLGFRPRGVSAVSGKSEESLPDANSTYNSSSVTSSPSGKYTKRHSNNLFGSAKFRDYTYIRTATQNKQSNRAQHFSQSPQGDANRKNSAVIGHVSAHSAHSAPLQPPAPYSERPTPADFASSKTPPSFAAKRASMALEDAIRELEEEAEDEIVMPRSAPISRTTFEAARPFDSASSGMAVSSDHQMYTELEERRVSPVPVRAGYIPGMPRPMTPRLQTDSEDFRSHSTTPRAVSPLHESYMSGVPSGSPTSLSRHESTNSSRTSSRLANAPMFIQRSPSGRYSPEDLQRSKEGFAYHFEFPTHNGPKRRPVSPLSEASFQPMAMSPTIKSPLDVGMGHSQQSGAQKPFLNHNRNGSWFSDSGSDVRDSLDRAKQSVRSLKSPALPDSPILEQGAHSTGHSISSRQPFDSRPASAISGLDIDQPVQSINRPARSPTPNQHLPRSPISSSIPTSDISPINGSRRSSKQHVLSSSNPFSPLMFSPIARSSRSSLESTGSSFHSWEAEHKDRTYDLFNDSDAQQQSWHDLTSSQSNATSPASSPNDEADALELVNKHAGLKIADFVAIQEKLISAVVSKHTPDRSPSLRRRRPSTSQSNYSVTGIRIGSPPPQSQAQSSSQIFNNESYPKSSQSHHALLHAVVDSIQSPRAQSHQQPSFLDGADSGVSSEISPSARRNRDLAQVLFGLDNDEDPEAPERTRDHTSQSEVSPVSLSVATTMNTNSNTLPQPWSPSSTVTNVPYSLSRNPSSSKLPQTAAEQAELAVEVQRKAEAAMMALKKHPSVTNLLDNASPASSVRKRIDPSQISSPTLVSASTIRTDTIPLRNPAITQTGSAPPSKLSSRFKKLTGTLRKTNANASDDLMASTTDLRSPPSEQTINYYPSTLHPPGGPALASAIEHNRSKVTIPSPPASAGPGLKSFMARFRGKQRHDPYVDTDRPPAISSPLSSTNSLGMTAETHHFSASGVRDELSTPNLPEMAPSLAKTAPIQTLHVGTQDESQALKQLFDAASNLGLDQQKLNDLLLVRSGSVSSTSDWTKSTLASVRDIGTEERKENDKTAHSDTNERSVTDNPVNRAPSVARKSVRKTGDFSRKAKESQGNAIVRRTIILASDSNVDLTSLMRKASRHKRNSVTSFSSRSIHDRVPTPPPPRSPTNKRFSADASPPVPQLPRIITAHADHLLGVSPVRADGSIEKSNSTYDSLYEMYTEDGKAVSQFSENIEKAQMSSESGPGIEVLELANGELIWNIVNGLRDEDSESVYPNRMSFSSEYQSEEGMRVLFKEHTRGDSKGSELPFSPQKSYHTRPETQVFMTPSAQMGRLIENLSKGLDAGTFNFSVVNGQHGQLGHSASSSLSENEMNWTVEQRLDHMLGTMRST